MTDNNTTIATPADANATDQAIGTLEYLHPIMLELETNVRDDAALDADFVASVLMNPIVAVRTADGVVRVRRSATHPGRTRVRAGHHPGLRAAGH